MRDRRGVFRRRSCRRSDTMSYIADLLAAVHGGNPVAADELADFIDHVLEYPDRTIAEAFNLAERASESPDLECEPGPDRHMRDALIREFANSLDLPSTRAQAEAILMMSRTHNPDSDQETKPESRILCRLREIGVADLSERQVRRILGGK
jgi:hypothetical protein